MTRIGLPTFSRRDSLKAVAAAGLCTSVGVSPSLAQDAEIKDEDIFRFALNLEYLEAEFYLRAINGMGLADKDITGIDPQGPVVGGKPVPFKTPAIKQYAQEIASDEKAHVLFLRAALGGAKVSRPKIDLQTSFTAAAMAG